MVSCMRESRIALLVLLSSLTACMRASKLEEVFSDLSVGVPGYQRVETFTHPVDAVKGDYFSLDLVQSPNQFGAFITRLGLAETNVLSTPGLSHVLVAS